MERNIDIQTHFDLKEVYVVGFVVRRHPTHVFVYVLKSREDNSIYNFSNRFEILLQQEDKNSFSINKIILYIRL